MNDQTSGESPGTGPNNDAPLKRDRQRLRSSKPWPTTPDRSSDDRPTAAPVPPVSPPEDLHEPELSAAERLFAGQWTASLPTPVMPASTIPPEPMAFTGAADASHSYDVDLVEPDAAERAVDASPPKSRFGLGFLKKTKSEPDAVIERPEDPPVDEVEPVRSATPAARPASTRAVYVPPGGFTSSGHPRLGPLAPVPAPKHSGLAGLDIAAMVAAFIAPPIGLITAIVALVRGRKIRGWASDLARAAVSVSLVMMVVFAAVGGSIWIQETERAEQLAAVKAEQRAHDRVAATSAPFCEVLAANPAIYSTADPDYGWPVVDVPGGYLAAISNYSAVWAQIASVAPAGIAEETAAISQRVAGIVNIASALGSQNRAGDLLGLHAETDLATVESWYVEYCDAPEVPAE